MTAPYSYMKLIPGAAGPGVEARVTTLTSTGEALVKSASFRKTTGTLILFILTFYLVISVLQTTSRTSHDTFATLVNQVNHEPLEEGDIEFELENCGCLRRLKNVNPNPSGLLLNETTCGINAFHRGPGQKIVGFSFYGDINSDYSKKKGYFEGIVGNLELLPKYYPGWVMRLYYDLDKNDPVFNDLCQLACQNPQIDICDARNLPGTPFKDASKVFAMNWRFFPTLDPQVDWYVSRDLDSRFNLREFAAVQDWFQSGKAFHTMRDHPNHGVPMLGSAWGTRLTDPTVRLGWLKTWKKGITSSIVWAKRNDYGPDQTFLKRFVWPWAKRNMFSHDAYHCMKYPETHAFPTKRKDEPNNFVASVIAENHILYQKCPIQCRPKDHRDWGYC